MRKNYLAPFTKAQAIVEANTMLANSLPVDPGTTVGEGDGGWAKEGTFEETPATSPKSVWDE